MQRTSLFDRWPTGVVLLLLLTAALLPLGLVLAWTANQVARQTTIANVARADQQGHAAARAIEGLIARNALALRLAANGALATGEADPCAVAVRSLAITPAIGREFLIRDPGGAHLCNAGDFVSERDELRVAPGDVKVWVSPRGTVQYSSGLIGGSVTGELPAGELRDAAVGSGDPLNALAIGDGTTRIKVIDDAARPQGAFTRERSFPIANGQLQVRVLEPVAGTALGEQLLMLLPLLMWLVAALLSWLAVRRLLLVPLARLQRTVGEYEPGDAGLELPTDLGPTPEIRDLCLAFERAVERIESAEIETRTALEGQQRLVREVHHRVKNNLQVVASLLSIHGRTAAEGEAKAAYSSIGRRVDALSVVHRNHYAEMEDNRGIALRPLLTELSAGLRAAAPTEARAMPIELDLESPSTTQDVAIAVAFLLTEIIEFAMLRKPKDPVEISLRRASELTATLSVTASVLMPETDAGDISKVQFERIADGLARQLRSTLERKLGRYTVTIPVFPDREH